MISKGGVNIQSVRRPAWKIPRKDAKKKQEANISLRLNKLCPAAGGVKK